MRDEIDEQPVALDATVRQLRAAAAVGRSMIAARPSVVFFARGTSDNAVTYGRYLFEVVGGRFTASGSPSVATLYDADIDLRATTAVFVSQSGHTTELVEAAAWARRRGAATLAITNTPASPLRDECDHTLVTAAGVERAVPATKSHTAQLVALAMLAGDRWSIELDQIGTTIGALLASLRSSDALAPITAHLAAADLVVCVGRGYTLSSAQEAALKLEETTGRACIGLSTADLQHGPVAVVAAGTALVVFRPPSGPCLPSLDAVSSIASSRGATVISIGGPPAAGLALPAGSLSEELSPIALTVVAQVLAEATTVALGLDPDRPHGLTKVTQTAQ